MIIYDSNLLKQLSTEYIELNKYKNAYNKKLELYSAYKVIVENNTNSGMNQQDLQLRKNEIQIQINLIDKAIILLDNIFESLNNDNNLAHIQGLIDGYNIEYKKIEDSYIQKALAEDEVMTGCVGGIIQKMATGADNEKNKVGIPNDDNKVKNVQNNDNEVKIEQIKNDNVKEDTHRINNYTNEYTQIKNHQTTVVSQIDQVNENVQRINNSQTKNNNGKTNDELRFSNGNIIENNDTLIISEKIQKVILPYTVNEIKEALNNEGSRYTCVEEVINDKYVREFTDFRFQFASRYKETMKLAREREQFGIADSISLSLEMMKKRYLHPAIIAACRTLTELDVYLDCLDKNELEDFKIFKIKFELYPVKVKESKYDEYEFEEEKASLWKKFKNLLGFGKRKYSGEEDII